MSQEIWKDIPNYEGLYQVSNLGRVKSLPKKAGRSNRSEKILNPINSNGYFIVHLSHHNELNTMFTHRLVAQAFVPNPENKPCVNHIDGNKQNNRVDNLEWCTRSENDKHAYKLNLRTSPKYWKNKNGCKHPRSKLVQCIETGEIYESINIANEKFKTTHIGSCCRRERNITKGYHWRFVK